MCQQTQITLLDYQGSIPGRGNGRDVSFHHCSHTGSEAHPASYPMAWEALSSKVRQWEQETGHSPPSSSKVKNVWS